MGRLGPCSLLAIVGILGLSSAALAQETAIAGTVKDSSGAILPGVTVEVSSPALIEKTRSTITDRAGQYKIIDLSPGVYAVTFTLASFSGYKREGIELTYGFTAPVNAEMRVGNMEETVTVSAASPVVDIQSLAHNVVMTRDVMDAIPTGKNIQAVGILIPGTALQVGGGSALSRDVGGSGNMQQSPLTYHGSTASVTTVDGLRMNDFEVSGQYADLFNDGSFQEVSYSTGADTIEMGQGGLRINMVPKDGGNVFKGTVPVNWTGSAWQWDNLNQKLRDRGLTNVSEILKIYDFNPSVGGPVKKDKLWYQLTFRRQRVDKTIVDSYFDKNPDPIKYEADLSHPAVDDGWAWNAAVRTTYQINQKSKATFYFDRSNRERPHWGASATNPPEASGRQVLPMEFTESLRFQSTLTKRLLFEAAFGEYHQDYSELYQPEVTPTTYRISDQVTGKTCCAFSAQVIHLQKLFDYSAKLSYVTGSHSLMVGWTGGNGPHETITTRNGNLSMRFGATTVHADASGFGPNQVTLNLPTDQLEYMDMDSGLFVQDKWTFKRATVSAGFRFDWFIGSVGTEAVLPNPWLAAKTFDPIKNVPNWKDFSPRLGIAYDLFGNGKTALKFSASRYVDPQTVGFATAQGPIGRLTSSISLTWTDTNLDYTIFNPDGSVQASELA
ncbi:MAG TPA: carboxypeptidase regulatory-like domain-containing protein, partial [Vicinamibacterales bacterium]|nr:carboxypeptidase regulatory-like domain-containing protein [Vicinamibacterales bacterium]